MKSENHDLNTITQKEAYESSTKLLYSKSSILQI